MPNKSHCTNRQIGCGPAGSELSWNKWPCIEAILFNARTEIMTGWTFQMQHWGRDHNFCFGCKIHGALIEGGLATGALWCGLEWRKHCCQAMKDLLTLRNNQKRSFKLKNLAKMSSVVKFFSCFHCNRNFLCAISPHPVTTKRLITGSYCGCLLSMGLCGTSWICRVPRALNRCFKSLLKDLQLEV